MLFEYAFHILKVSRKKRIPLGQTVKQELKFFFKFGSNVKPVLEGSEEDDKSEIESHPKSTSDRSKSKSEKSRTTANGDSIRPYGFVISPSLDRLTETP